jgi:hypothetical protein
MKFFLPCLILFKCAFVFAQTSLPVDEKGKVIFYEVIKAEDFKKGILYENAKNWLTENSFHIESTPEDSIAGKIVASQSFYVYARGYISKKIHGKITYKTSIEVKDNRYRYSFSDFTFFYYKEDRNYQMVPTGKEKPIEESKASGWQSLWEQHKKNTQVHITRQIQDLKSSMIELPKPKTDTVISKKLHTEDW